MDIENPIELEAAVRLQRLARHTRLLSRAKGPRLFGRPPIFTLPVVLAPVTVVLLMGGPLGVLGGLAVGLLVFVIGVAVLAVGDRVDALVELLLSLGAIGPELPARGTISDPPMNS